MFGYNENWLNENNDNIEYIYQRQLFMNSWSQNQKIALSRSRSRSKGLVESIHDFMKK